MQDREILDSWKEISSYLNRTRRTCLRWEKEYSLPIHRFDGTPRARVYAYKDELDRWLEELLNHKELPRKTTFFMRSKKVLLVLVPIMVLVLLMVVGWLIWQPFPKGDVSLASGEKPCLAVMYFKNNTGARELDRWRNALSDSIITDLSQSRYIRVISSDRMYSILRKLDLLDTQNYGTEELEKVAEAGGADYVIQGSFSTAGDKFRVDYALQDILTGEVLGSESVEGEGEASIYAMVDELTRKIKSELNISAANIADDMDEDISWISTSSLEALKHWSRALTYASETNWELSVQSLQKAVAADPEFALAYNLMATDYNNMGKHAERDAASTKAMELRDKTSYRERYKIEGYYYHRVEKNLEKTIEAYTKVLDVYPQDGFGNHMLGQVYRELEQWDKAIKFYRVMVDKGEDWLGYHVLLAIALDAKGLHVKAQEVLENYLNEYSDHYFVRYTLAYSYLNQGKYDSALSEALKAQALNPKGPDPVLTLGDIYACRGNLTDAERLYQQLVDMPSPGAKGYGRGGLMYLYLLQGKISRAIEQARQGFDLVNKPGNPRQKLSWLSRSLYLYHTTGNLNESLNEYENMWKLALESPDLEIQLIALWAKGLDYLKMNSMDKAQETAAELEKRCFDSLNRNLMRYCEHLSGLIEIKRGDYLKAVEHLERALFLANSQAFSRSMGLRHPWHACIRDALASAQLKAGNWERARQEYAEITRLSVGRLDAGDIYVKAFYNLGKIYEEQGDRAKAAENYAKFLDLWKDADPGIVEVEDAKKRMAKF